MRCATLPLVKSFCLSVVVNNNIKCIALKVFKDINWEMIKINAKTRLIAFEVYFYTLKICLSRHQEQLNGMCNHTFKVINIEQYRKMTVNVYQDKSLSNDFS